MDRLTDEQRARVADLKVELRSKLATHAEAMSSLLDTYSASVELGDNTPVEVKSFVQSMAQSAKQQLEAALNWV